MKCERIAELLPDYLQGALRHEQDDFVEQHLETCANCREEVALWRELAMLPQEQPSPALRERFNAMLLAYQEARGEKPKRTRARRGWLEGWGLANWLHSPVAGVAMAMVFLVVGFFAGRFADGRPPVQKESPELAMVQSELANMRQLVVLSMLQQQSASGRLQGVTFSTRQEQADPKVLAALLHTLRYDTNVDVRLAAIDALGRHGNQPQVRTGLIEALNGPQSPLVQVALIDLLVDLRDKAAVPQLQKFQQDAALNPAVRQHAEWALAKLSY